MPALRQSLHADLTVVGQHQDDLAEGVSYLGSALKGFQSIAYSGSTPVSWGNIFVNPASLSNTFGVIGPCGVFDDVLNQARTVTASWPIEHLTADRIRQAVQCGAAHARTVRDTLRTERATGDEDAGAVAA